MEAKSLKSYYDKPSFRTRDTVRLFDALAQARAPFTLFGSSSRIAPRQVGSGIMTGNQGLGTNLLQLNSSNGNVIMSDGTNNRLLLGNSG